MEKPCKARAQLQQNKIRCVMLDMHCSSCPCSASLPAILHNSSCLFRWGVKGLEELFWDTVLDFWNTDVRHNTFHALDSLTAFLSNSNYSDSNSWVELSCVLILVKPFPFQFSMLFSDALGNIISTRVVELVWSPRSPVKSVDNGRCVLQQGPTASLHEPLVSRTGCPEQESPCSSVVRDYSEGRELGDRSQQHKTHVMD